MAFNWSHSGPLPWPSADERAHSLLHYPLSFQGFLTMILGEDSERLLQAPQLKNVTLGGILL